MSLICLRDHSLTNLPSSKTVCRQLLSSCSLVTWSSAIYLSPSL
nr:MAG TPA: hypothetical protein [Crassvirales sp.]